MSNILISQALCQLFTVIATSVETTCIKDFEIENEFVATSFIHEFGIKTCTHLDTFQLFLFVFR